MELSIQCLDKKTLEDGKIQAMYAIEPLERGFAITLGNTFRRICLSHLPGTAVQSVRIKGVTHEFSVMEGVLEDVVEIILNLKSLVFRTELGEPFELSLQATGPKEIKAADIELPTGVEIVNPELHILTITDKVDFSMQLTAGRGRGYVLSQEQNVKDKGIDTIAVDSSFMPITQFAYSVEQIRIGESSEASTNKFEKLIISITSNGSLEPDVAMSQAAQLLMQKLTPLMNFSGEALQSPLLLTPMPDQLAAPSSGASEDDDYSIVGIETLNLSVRAYNCLKRANINDLGQLLELTTDELLGIKNFGRKSAEEVIQILNENKLYLADDPRRSEVQMPQPSALLSGL